MILSFSHLQTIRYCIFILEMNSFYGIAMWAIANRTTLAVSIVCPRENAPAVDAGLNI